AFGVLLGGFLADRFGRHDLVATVALIIAAAAFVLPALMPMSAPVLIAVLTLSGLAFGTVQPARDMMVRAITPSGEMGKVFGFLSVGMSVGASASPLVFGWFLDNQRPDWVFFGAGLFMLLTLVAALSGRFVGKRTGLRRH
ncbi:MAG: MFS transporter, partial [Alphaproteobacteria bacterium]|nr:MFS transporter [Alphaproteobacteria bacterium]